jgi:hypothetical protein
MPAAASGPGKASVLNCGLVRERGTDRMSTSRWIAFSRSSAINSPTERLAWPIVKTGLAAASLLVIEIASSLRSSQ